MLSTISPLGRGTPKQLVDEFFFYSGKQGSTLLVEQQGLVFFIRSGRGADE